MGDRSGIQWTDATWNPMVGCTHVSAGCDNCYAAHQASTRLAHTPQYKGLAVNGMFTGEVRLLPERLDQPLRWAKPRLVFVNSMSDLFHPKVPVVYQAHVWAVMAMSPRHTYQVLTKRPQAAARVLYSIEFRRAFLANLETLYPERKGLERAPAWPLPNVWLGTSIEDNTALRRKAALTAAPARIRFLSLEPLLGPLPDLDLNGIHWAIIGGESGPGARPMMPGWAAVIIARCHDEEVPVFMKQMGTCYARQLGLADPKGGAWDDLPAGLRYREYPPTYPTALETTP